MSVSDDTLTPVEAAAKIVADLLADLPEERKVQIREAIEAAMQDWGDLTSSVASESGER
jgi:hypothetical protein